MAPVQKEVASAVVETKNAGGAEERRTRKIRKRAKKDKDAPKRGKSAFICFSIERRKQIVQKTPSLSSQVKEVSKIIGGEWARMTENDKLPYENQAVLDKQRYEREKEEYQRNKKND